MLMNCPTCRKPVFAVTVYGVEVLVEDRPAIHLTTDRGDGARGVFDTAAVVPHECGR